MAWLPLAAPRKVTGTVSDQAEVLSALKRIEALLSASLGIQVEEFLRSSGVAKPRPRSVDRMLNDFGLTGVQVANLLGKSPQAVSQVLARDKEKSRGSSGRKTQ